MRKAIMCFFSYVNLLIYALININYIIVGVLVLNSGVLLEICAK